MVRNASGALSKALAPQIKSWNAGTRRNAGRCSSRPAPALMPKPERASSGIVGAAQGTYFRMLHEQLADEGVYVLHAVIVGPIGDGGHDPVDIAQVMWDAARQRARAQVAIR